MALIAICGYAEKKVSKVEIHLRNGQVVKGAITERDERVVTIISDHDGGTYHYTTDEINYISHLTKRKNYDTSKFRGFIDVGYRASLATTIGWWKPVSAMLSPPKPTWEQVWACTISMRWKIVIPCFGTKRKNTRANATTPLGATLSSLSMWKVATV